MMKKKLRCAAGIVAAAAVTLSLAACSSGGTAGASEVPSGVTLTMWHTTADSDALLNLYKAYEEHSGNTIELVDIPSDSFPATVQTKWSTGDRPDILEFYGAREDLRPLNPSQNLVDLSDLDFVDALGDMAGLSGSIDAVTYGATLGPVTSFGLFYNKAVLADAGLSTPESYADLADVCSALGGTGVTPIFEAAGSGFPPMILSVFNYMAEHNGDLEYADRIVAGDAKINDPKGPFVAGLEAYVDMRDNGCFNSDAITATFESGLASVFGGQAAFIALPSDMAGMLIGMNDGDAALVSETVGFISVSATGAVGNISPSPSGTYYVPKNKDAAKQAAAIDFVNFVTGDGYQAYVDEAMIVPVLTTATAPELPGIMQDVAASMDGATLTVNAAIPGFGAIVAETNKLLAGQQSPQDTADQLQLAFEQAKVAAGL